MLIMEAILLCAVFFVMCYLGTGSDEKNIKSYSSYPDEIQAIISQNHSLKAKIKTSSPIAVFISNIAVFGVLLFLLGLPVKDEDFLKNFISLSVLGQGLNLFDFLVIDLLWWRNSPRVRFTGTENMKELYRSPTKHFKAFLRGILAFLIVALIDGWILTLI